MTDEEIRIKVAEVMGWTVVQDEHGVCGTIDWIHWHSPAGFPKYPESLDACAEFEKTLTDTEFEDYFHELEQQVPFARPQTKRRHVCAASPKDRCLAYLRVKGILP